MNSFLGQIVLFAGNYVPKNYAACNGQLLSVSENQALYALIGNTYGGDKNKFALPDLRSRLPIGVGQGVANPKEGTGPNLTSRVLAAVGGSEGVSFSVVQMAPHRHTISALDKDVTSNEPTGGYLGTTPSGTAFYFTEQTGGGAPTKSVMGKGMLASTGENQPHENRMPMLPLSYVMCIQGVYPTPQNAIRSE